MLDNTVWGRYERDPHFRTLVDHMTALIWNAKFTPTEMREASMLAMIIHEQHTIRPHVIPLRETT